MSESISIQVVDDGEHLNIVIDDAAYTISTWGQIYGTLADQGDLQAALDAKVDDTEVATTATANKLLKLDANGDLPADITGNAATATEVAWTGISGKPSSFTPAAHLTSSHSDWPLGVTVDELAYLDGVTSNVQSQLNLKADLVDGKVPSGQLPSYVDDVVEVANYAALPGTGEAGKIYVTLDDNKTWRWSGSAYIQVTSGNQLSIAAGKTFTASNTLTLTATDGANVSLGVGGTVIYTTNKISDLNTTSSAELAGVISDETGSGSLVFATSPTLVTPNIGVATGTSFNSITGLATASPLVDGTAAVGTSTKAAKEDHVHPTDTTRAPVASPTFTGTVTLPSTTSIGNVSSTELGYLDGVTSGIQAQLDAKANDAEMVKLTGDQTVAGAKTFVSSVTTQGLYVQLNRIDTSTIIPDGYNAVIFGDFELGPDATITCLGNATFTAIG